jgi:hypothetical protein
MEDTEDGGHRGQRMEDRGVKKRGKEKMRGRGRSQKIMGIEIMCTRRGQ